MRLIFLALLIAWLPASVAALSPMDIESRVNSVRQSNQLSVLKDNSILDESAQAKADDICSRNYWSHNTPDGVKPWAFIENAGYGKYIKLGENLAYGPDYLDAGTYLIYWVNSPEHFANITGDYTEQGVGVTNCSYYQNKTNQLIIVNHFGNPLVTSKHSVIHKSHRVDQLRVVFEKLKF